ncbi:MAG: Exodeoxyribonuclease 7 small subunit [Alphaproteobacteria bacterium MarineAlpha3_Bin5]|nr:MAG: Exodeoxyribonuclease 7 small subunit [Alphaproteobacteria bacterium MarineAlpha3_Bin5]
MSEQKIPEDINRMDFETALDELETIVRELEIGENRLENSIQSYTRGTLLKQHCEKKLKDAQARIDKIIVDSAGQIDTEKMDIE